MLYFRAVCRRRYLEDGQQLKKFKDDHNKQGRISAKNVLESYFFNMKTKNKKLISDNCDEAIKSTLHGVSNYRQAVYQCLGPGIA